MNQIFIFLVIWAMVVLKASPVYVSTSSLDSEDEVDYSVECPKQKTAGDCLGLSDGCFYCATEYLPAESYVECKWSGTCVFDKCEDKLQNAYAKFNVKDMILQFWFFRTGMWIRLVLSLNGMFLVDLLTGKRMFSRTWFQYPITFFCLNTLIASTFSFVLYVSLFFAFILYGSWSATDYRSTAKLLCETTVQGPTVLYCCSPFPAL